VRRWAVALSFPFILTAALVASAAAQKGPPPCAGSPGVASARPTTRRSP